MYENSGEKIQGVATFFCVIGIIISVILGIVLISIGSAMRYDGGPFVWSGIIIMVAGSFISWVSSLMIAGFGELISSQHKTEQETHQLVKKIEVLTSILTSSAQGEIDPAMKAAEVIQAAQKTVAASEVKPTSATPTILGDDLIECPACHTRQLNENKTCLTCGVKFISPEK